MVISKMTRLTTNLSMLFDYPRLQYEWERENGMNRTFDVPMPRCLGVKLVCKIPGRDKTIILKIMECDVPLPVSGVEGEPEIFGVIYTTAGDISIDSKVIKQPDLTYGKFKPWVVEDLLYDALGRDKPKEELNPELLGPVNRKITRMGSDEDDVPEKKSA